MKMNSASQNLKATVLIDSIALRSMGFIEMVTRVEQMRATGRYTDIHIDGELGAIVAEVVA